QALNGGCLMERRMLSNEKIVVAVIVFGENVRLSDGNGARCRFGARVHVIRVAFRTSEPARTSEGNQRDEGDATPRERDACNPRPSRPTDQSLVQRAFSHASLQWSFAGASVAHGSSKRAPYCSRHVAPTVRSPNRRGGRKRRAIPASVSLSSE